MPSVLERLRSALEAIDGANVPVSPEVLALAKFPSAVLLLLLPRGAAPEERQLPGPTVDVEEEFDVLFTRRSLSLRLFPGFTVLPGGKVDPKDESVIATALREAQEEVGLDPAAVTVLGVLPPQLLRHGHFTYGVVGFMDEAEREWRHPVNEAEIESVFRLPLHRFLSARRVHNHRTKLPPPLNGLIHTIGMVDVVPGQRDGPREVWGMTAVFVIEAAMLAYGQMPQFPDFYVWQGIRPEPEAVKRCQQEMCEVYADLLSRAAKL